jgi:hypothetical protein
MAIITPTPQFISDLSGDSTDVSTVSFALNGTGYEIDLTSTETDDLFSLLHPYVDNGRRASVNLNTAKRTRSSNGNGRVKNSETAQIRAWAQEQGIPVASKGRIKPDVVASYHATVG